MRALVCGAGKIGRGFLGQLLHRSGYRLCFLDADGELVRRLNEEGRYRVEIAGRPELGETIPVESAVTPEDRDELRRLVASVDLLVSSVGAANIPGLARRIGALLGARQRPLDWLICENASAPAASIRSVLEATSGGARLLARGQLGLVETLVLRSGLPAAECDGPLTVRVSDWWTLPADADAFVREAPRIEGLAPRRNFTHELRRKLYTFNGLNGPVSYVGHARGYRLLHEAARAPPMQVFIENILSESAHGLVREYGLDPAEHARFQQLAREKYRDPRLGDTLERNARDSARKLAADERLVGPASLALKHGRPPIAYAQAIAAAMDYDGSSDPGTRRVRALVETDGVGAVLTEVCGLASDSELRRLVELASKARSYMR